jgi:hypothetical protein
MAIRRFAPNASVQAPPQRRAQKPADIFDSTNTGLPRQPHCAKRRNNDTWPNKSLARDAAVQARHQRPAAMKNR